MIDPNRNECPHCGSQIEPDAQTCPQCGQPVNQTREPQPTPEPENSPFAPAGTSTNGNEALFIVGLVLGILGLSCCCNCCSWIFSLPSLIIGIVLNSRRDSRGIWLIVIGALGLLGVGIFSHYRPPLWMRPRWIPNPNPWPGPWRSV